MNTLIRISSLIALFALGLVACSGGDSPVETEPPQEAPLEPLAYSHVGRTPVSDTFEDIAAAGDVMFAVGRGGAVVAKLPGEGWTAMPRVTRKTLSGVTMLNDKTVVAVGFDIIILSKDRGATWEIVAENTGSLSDVSGNDGFAIAVGSSNVWISDDSGKSWRPATSLPPGNLTHVTVIEKNLVFAANSSARIFRSTNNGDTWLELSSDFDGSTSLSSFAFSGEKTGVVGVRSPNEVYFTSNGGQSWDPIGIDALALDIAFFDGENGALVTTAGEVYTTDNTGKTWTPMSFLVPLDEFDVAPRDIARGPDAIALAGTGGYLIESLKGSPFAKVHSGVAGNIARVGLSSLIGVASVLDVDHPEDFLRSLDEGQSWSAINLGIGAARRIVVAGEDGLLITKKTVMRSGSGGVDWTEVFVDPNASFVDAAIVDSRTYVVCGGSQGILHTSSFGAQWANVTPQEALGKSITKVCFFPGTTVGVAAGPEIMVRSTDGGETWSPVEFLGREPSALAAASATVAIAANNNFDIWRTTDGGQSWDIIGQLPGRASAAAFADARRGLLVGQSGLILETLDGGLTWSEPRIATANALDDVAFLDEGTAIIVGDRGTILRGVAP